MNEFIPKLVDSNHYQLWTDVLHARKLANQTRNKMIQSDIRAKKWAKIDE